MGAIIDFFRRGTLRRRAIWADVAARRGGRHILPKWYRPSDERIEVVVSGVSIVFDTYVVSTGNSSTTYTRCVGQAIAGKLPTFRVYKEGAFSTFGKFLGTMDLRLGGGDDAFDSTFMVKADDAAATREIWTASAKSKMRTQLPAARVESDGARIKLVEQGTYKNAARINSALDLVAELACRDLFGVAAMRAVGGPGYVEKRGGYPQVERSDPAPVLIEVRDIGGRLATVASLKKVGDWRPVTASIKEGALVDRNAFQQFAALAHAQVAKVGTATLVVESGQAPRVQWEGVEHDPERLIAGARMLGALEGIGQQRL